MSIAQGSLLLASDIIDLKAKVKAEMARRVWGAAPLNGYAGSAYDYTVTPSTTSGLLQEHAQKIITPLDAVTGQGYTYENTSPIKSMNLQLARVTSYATETQLGSSSCAANCSGLCVGCSGTCTGSCTGTCTGTCTSCTSCTGTCTSCTGCSGTCTSCTGCSGCGGCGGCSGCSGCGWCGSCGSCSGCGSGCSGK